MRGEKRAAALAERLVVEDVHTEGLIDRLDSFLENMESISDRLMARLDKLDEAEERRGLNDN